MSNWYGSISRLVNLVFRKDSQLITVRPNQMTTYTAARDVQLPPQDAAAIIVSESATQTLTNKTISGASNTISNVSLTAGVTGVLPIANGGTNSSASLNNNRVVQSSGGAIVEAAAITAARALISDANGIPTHSATTATELGYVSGVTSAIQTQIDGKVAKAGDTMTGDLVLDNQKSLVLREATGSGTNFVAHQAAGTLASDTTYVWVEAPSVSGYVLASDTSGNLSWVNNATTSSFKSDWITSDGTTLAITHNLGTLDVMVQIYDKTDGSTIYIDSVVRTSTNVLTVTASEAPGAAGWRVLISAV